MEEASKNHVVTMFSSRDEWPQAGISKQLFSPVAEQRRPIHGSPGVSLDFFGIALKLLIPGLILVQSVLAWRNVGLTNLDPSRTTS